MGIYLVKRLHCGNTNYNKNTLAGNTFSFYILEMHTNLYKLADSKNVRLKFFGNFCIFRMPCKA